MNNNLYISIVSPVYKAEKIVKELVNRIEEEVINLTSNYEIILIEDFSPDDSWKEILQIASKNPKVKAVRFSRNFGQHAAIKAGVELAEGDCCIVMDCDLQDDPKYIKFLIEKWQEGNDIVLTIKKERKHSFFKNLTAKIFNEIFNFLVDFKQIKTNDAVGAYSLISKKVMKSFISFNDYQFHYLMVLRWLGFKKTYIEIEHNERFEGRSSYSLKRLLEHAIVGIVYQSDKLLRLSIYLGFSFSIVSIISSVYIVIQYFITKFQSGWTSLFVLMLFSTGIILVSIGVLGLYIGKMFEQVKNRPIYIIDKKINL